MAVDFQYDELGKFDDFEYPPIDASRHRKSFCTIGLFCCVLSVCVVVAVFVSAWVCSPPMWLQPTIVGILWASLFLVGAAAGSVRRGSAWFAFIACCYVWLSQNQLQSLTSLVEAECALIAVCSFSAGWLVTQLEFSGRESQSPFAEVKRYQQWTIWDLGLLTTLVAVICYALPRLESPLILLTQVGFVMLGGCISSWMAYRWVFDDNWTLTKLIAMIVGSGLCVWLLGLWLVSQQPASELSIGVIATWMLTGPIAVIAAQGLTVLALLTAIRIDQGSLNTCSLNTGALNAVSQSEGMQLGDPTAGDDAVEGLRIYSA